MQVWRSQANSSQGQVGETRGYTHGRAHPKGQLGSLPVHSGQAEGGPSDTRSSDFFREMEHLSFYIKSPDF